MNFNQNRGFSLNNNQTNVTQSSPNPNYTKNNNIVGNQNIDSNPNINTTEFNVNQQMKNNNTNNNQQNGFKV